VKDVQRSFQASMKRVDGGDEDGDGGVVAATQAGLVMIEKKASTRLSQGPRSGWVQHHVAHLDAARRGGEPALWGGDFNQQLRPMTASRAAEGFRMATAAGIARLWEAFQGLGPRALTGGEHRIQGAWAIDHLAVSDSVEGRRTSRCTG
jgi:hypothetical protein